MSDMVFPLPVSLEQIGAVIRRMSVQELQRLLELAPDLRQVALQSVKRSEEQARETVAQLQKELSVNLGGKFLSPEEPFLGDMTLGEYLNLPEKEKGAFWESWADTDLMDIEEREVKPDALLA
ncbi:MAG: hypothetical protein JXA33_12125 [Anaerolineae bacterium]|nr:hypothetical protein [Anaerolineae bacterium]